MTDTRRDLVMFGGFGIALAGLGIVAVQRGFDYGRILEDELSGSFAAAYSLTSLHGMLVIFTLEWLIPARPAQRVFSPSVLLDAFYVVVQLPVVAATVALVVYPLAVWLQPYTAAVAVDPAGRLPWPVTLLLGLLVSDFLLWTAHVAKHKVPLFWRFHIIHHSQENLNLFTANRTHPIDALIERFAGLVPAAVLLPGVAASAERLAWFGLVMAWFIRFEHANIRLDLGPLRYVLVTPQSHRVHHSVHPTYWSTNFANVFCWDRLVGWQHPDHTSYPETGVCDPAFPEPTSFSPRALAAAYAAQLRYPFRRTSVRIATQPPSLPCSAAMKARHTG